MRHWEELVNCSDLSLEELRQIPSDNVTYFHSAVGFYLENGWDTDSLLEGTGLNLKDFEDFSKWLNPLQSELIVKNFFKNAPIFLPHKTAYYWGGVHSDEKTIFSTILKYTPYDELMGDAVRTSRKLENSFDYSVEKHGFNYKMKVIPKKFKYNRLLGYETYVSRGYLDTIHQVKKIKIQNRKSVCFSSDIKKIISFFYDTHNFSFNKNSISMDGKVIAKEVRAIEIPELVDKHKWNESDTVYQFIEDYIYMGELIFKKGAIYNAPFDCYTWSVTRKSLLLERFRNLLSININKSIPELEFQLDQNNLKSQEMLQMSTLLEIEKDKKELFMANIVHEIKSPLASIVMLIDSLRDNIPTESTFVKEGFCHLGDKSNKLINFVDNVMSYFSMDNNNFILSLEVIDLAFLMNDVLDNFTHVSLQGNVSIICPIMPDKYIIQGDYYRLLQVFLNIINNSVKFTTEGTIYIDAHFENSNIVISVKDTGIGIRQDKLDDIFNMFELIQASPGENSNGLGLGLYISKTIIIKHEGDIVVSSELGVGTEFKIILPLLDYE